MAMQSIFRLPWCSDPLESKPDLAAVQPKMRATPMMDIPLLNKLKRKRTDSPEPLRSPELHETKRKRIVEAQSPMALRKGKLSGARRLKDRDVQSQQAAPSTAEGATLATGTMSQDTLPESSPADLVSDMDTSNINTGSAELKEGDRTTTEDASAGLSLNPLSDMTPLQQMIEHQFNLEILQKHRELRLIDQELAKCQIALEQLRRCELIPYPGSQSMSADVSTGTGPALKSAAGFTQPEAPAPWGVTDGPYTRHYARWLLPDPMFDSVPIPQAAPPYDNYSSASIDARATRNSQSSTGRVGKRTNRDSIISLVQQPQTAQPITPAPRNKGGPLVIKRVSDNQFVKLVCNKCHRGDFSSVQGFLNHCRIAHKLDYKSHEAAAQDCGHVLEEHEQGLAATAPPPVGTTVRAPAVVKPAPLSAPVVAQVHPFNSPVLPRPTWKHQRPAYDRALAAESPASATDTSVIAASLVPSLSAPSLSKLFAKRGLGGDLHSATEKAKEKIDLGFDDETADDEDNSARASPQKKTSSSVMRSVKGSSAASSTQNGHRQPGQRPRPAPITAPKTYNDEIPESPQDAELSPHTAESNPGLVSDHDDDPASDPEEEHGSVVEHSHVLGIRRSCGDAMDVDVDVDYEHDEQNEVVRHRSGQQGEASNHSRVKR